MAWEQKKGPKIHCLTNPVTMQDTANLLLAAGGSAIMAQAPQEVEEITSFCQATLLNTGVPEAEKLEACILAGKRANLLGHPVILDPVGAGASRFRRKWLARLLDQVNVQVIRCNQEEACSLLSGCTDAFGGVESNVLLKRSELENLALKLSGAYSCTVLISGAEDIVSDGVQIKFISGGSEYMGKITGGGCMLSALCALFCGYGYAPYKAAVTSSKLWKESAELAELRRRKAGGGVGSFHACVFDAVEELCTRIHDCKALEIMTEMEGQKE